MIGEVKYRSAWGGMVPQAVLSERVSALDSLFFRELTGKCAVPIGETVDGNSEQVASAIAIPAHRMRTAHYPAIARGVYATQREDCVSTVEADQRKDSELSLLKKTEMHRQTGEYFPCSRGI